MSADTTIAIPIDITYEAKNGYLYVRGHRFEIKSITNVDWNSQYYFGLDDTPGGSMCYLKVNKTNFDLDLWIDERDPKLWQDAKKAALDKLVADIKALINF